MSLHARLNGDGVGLFTRLLALFHNRPEPPLDINLAESLDLLSGKMPLAYTANMSRFVVGSLMPGKMFFADEALTAVACMPCR